MRVVQPPLSLMAPWKRPRICGEAMCKHTSWEPADSQLLSTLSREEVEALREQGVRADIAAILVDDAGAVVRSEVTERFIAISPEQMRQIPRVVAVAGGAAKGGAIAAAARAGLITGLVADRTLAEAALNTEPVLANADSRS